MKWTRGDRSNVEDVRGRSGMRMGGIGLGGLLVVLLLSWLTGVDFLSLVGPGGLAPAPTESVGPGGAPLDTTPEEEELVHFVDAVMGDAQATWRDLLGGRYRDTTVVVFRDQYPSACGMGQAATGPFYCPADQKVYLDLGFFRELHERFGAPGDFAQAYVLAHELGHHVQNLLGVMEDVNLARQENPEDANELSVRLELQADCLAGVWGHSAYKQDLLESGDLEEGLNAASAVGDDRIQEQAGQRVNPESFTHGSGEQRVRWFRAGFDGGDPTACDTFKGDI